MTIDDTSYNDFVIRTSVGTGTSLNLNQSQAFIHLLKSNNKKRNLPTYKSDFTDMTYRCYFVSVDEESETELVYKPLYKKEEMVSYKNTYSVIVKCSCKLLGYVAM